jgi:hypothetical protein
VYEQRLADPKTLRKIGVSEISIRDARGVEIRGDVALSALPAGRFTAVVLVIAGLAADRFPF